MKNRNIRYLTGEGIRNIGTNRLMSFASVAVLLSCLVLIGSAFLIFLNVDKLLGTIQKQNVIMVYVEQNTKNTELTELQSQISELENVESCEYISKESGYNSLLQNAPEYASALDGEDASFLPDAFKVTVENMQDFSKTVSALSTLEHISSVRENSALAQKLENIRNAVTYICLGIIVILLIVALFIIANTVRITMFTRRLEISIMKAVGATNWFIRWPFLIEGVTIGVISAVLSLGVLWLIYFFVSDALETVFAIVDNSLVKFGDHWLVIFISYLAIGIITGGIGSIISIGRYLKEQGSVVVNED